MNLEYKPGFGKCIWQTTLKQHTWIGLILLWVIGVNGANHVFALGTPLEIDESSHHAYCSLSLVKGRHTTSESRYSTRGDCSVITTCGNCTNKREKFRKERAPSITSGPSIASSFRVTVATIRRPKTRSKKFLS